MLKSPFGPTSPELHYAWVSYGPHAWTTRMNPFGEETGLEETADVEEAEDGEAGRQEEEAHQAAAAHFLEREDSSMFSEISVSFRDFGTSPSSAGLAASANALPPTNAPDLQPANFNDVSLARPRVPLAYASSVAVRYYRYVWYFYVEEIYTLFSLASHSSFEPRLSVDVLDSTKMSPTHGVLRVADRESRSTRVNLSLTYGRLELDLSST
ncbi:hypothetical protein AAF712_009623 [Marasmius tenuissimus]|uniref:Uncharacterized protein n=1 Tax=Marasmius tenuissimus TaxID=585030 RepID=A0ABR2ZR20_9AGAR